MNYRDMTDEQMLDWGRQEAAQRIRDLSASRTAAGLQLSQDLAKQRRLEIGATTGQAANMVIRAQRADRVARAA